VAKLCFERYLKRWSGSLRSAETILNTRTRNDAIWNDVLEVGIANKCSRSRLLNGAF